MRYSKKFKRDWGLYLRIKDDYKFCGSDEPQIKLERFPDDPNGKDAKECFYLMDSQGKYEPCKEKQLLFEILRCKASLNWQIKQWAEAQALEFVDQPSLVTIVMCKNFLDEIQAERDFPKWVIDAVERQRNKILLEKYRK